MILTGFAERYTRRKILEMEPSLRLKSRSCLRARGGGLWRARQLSSVATKNRLRHIPLQAAPRQSARSGFVSFPARYTCPLVAVSDGRFAAVDADCSDVAAENHKYRSHASAKLCREYPFTTCAPRRMFCG